MSGNKSSSYTSKAIQSIDIDQISPELRGAFETILNQIQQTPFFDRNLNHQQQMELLNRPNTIESEFLRILYDLTNTSDIPNNIRDDLLEDLDRLTTPMTIIDIHADTDQYDNPEVEIDDEENDLYFDIDFDYYDDLENMILDELEFENDCDAFE